MNPLEALDVASSSISLPSEVYRRTGIPGSERKTGVSRIVSRRLSGLRATESVPVAPVAIDPPDLAGQRLETLETVNLTLGTRFEVRSGPPTLGGRRGSRKPSAAALAPFASAARAISAARLVPTGSTGP